MAATYPVSIVAFTTKTNKVDIVDASHINRLQEEVVAEQTELGKDPAGSVVDLKTRLAVALADTGAIANGTAFPTSPAPINGQIFYRSDEDTLYVYDGTTWDAIAAGNIQIFTSSGTFTAPGGVTKVYLSMIAGGGAGGGSTSGGGGSGGGGGAGGYLLNYPYTVIAGNNYAVTIGAGGTGSAGGDGTSGASTVFDSAVTCTAGTFGKGSLGSPASGAGSGGGGPSFNAVGSTGGGFVSIGGNGAAGSGSGGGSGGSPFGTGKNGSGTDVAGIAGGANTGAGGSGSGSGSAQANAGGAGGSGICIVMF